MIVTDSSKLHDISLPISSLEEELHIIGELEKELAISNKLGADGIGLAAPQIGILKRVAIIRIGTIKVNLVNSELIFKLGKVISSEGCLSIPGKLVDVQRYSDIIVESHGFVNTEKLSAYGLPAICIQHEMDHWDGILMTDKAILRHTEIGPNLLCPCGSKLKYKKCCGAKEKRG